jgi:hypothetical protein
VGVIHPQVQHLPAALSGVEQRHAARLLGEGFVDQLPHGGIDPLALEAYRRHAEFPSQHADQLLLGDVAEAHQGSAHSASPTLLLSQRGLELKLIDHAGLE